jgi:hypothetical protein
MITPSTNEPEPKMKTSYEVTIREVAEHWNFYQTVEADGYEEAWKKAAALVKQLGKGYRLVDVR